jgi:hypothetical protein
VKKTITAKFLIFVPVLAILLGVPALLAAAQISGEISNASTHQPLANQKVELISPQGGMAVVGNATTDTQGRFAFSGGQIDTGRFYLLQTTYQGVDYHAPVKFDPSGKALANLTVYESTHQQPALRVRSSRVIVRAEGSQARIQELFALVNPLERAYANSKGTFFFHISPQVENPTVAVVGLMNMPLPQTAEKGNSPGDYHISYALKPGMTVVMVAYNTDYSDKKFTLADSIPYPIDRAELFVFPPDLSVNSSLFSPAGKDAETGSQRLEAASLAAGAKLAAEVTGQSAAGASQEAGANSEESGGSTVKVVPDSVSAVGVPLLLCFLLVLLWALGIRVTKEYPRWKARQEGSPVRRKFQAKMETLLNSIADLDELFASGKMPEKQYWKERLELKAKAMAALKKELSAQANPVPAQKGHR